MNYETLHNDALRMSATSLTSLVTGKPYKPVRKSTLYMTLDLIQAARDGQIDQVQQHIHIIGKDKKKLNRKDQDQTTALHYAVRYGHLKIVKLLILNGANVNVQGESGATPLHYAARYVTKVSSRSNASPLPVRPPPPKRNPSSTSVRRISSAFSNMMPKKLSMPQIVDLAIKKRQKKGSTGDGFKMSMKRSESAKAALNMLANGTATEKRFEKEKKRPQSIPDFASVVRAEINQKISKRPTSMADFGSLQQVPSADSLKKKRRSILELAATVEEEETEKAFEMSTMFKDKEKRKNEKRKKSNLQPLTTRDKFDEHNSFKYRYDGEEELSQLEKGLVITTNSDGEENAYLKNIDALILPAVSQEERSRSNSFEMRSRSKTMLLDDEGIVSPEMLSIKSRDDLDTASDRLSGSSMENLDDNSVELFNSTKKGEEADDEDDVFLDNSSAETSFNRSKENKRLSVQYHRGSTGEDGFLNASLGVNNPAFKSSDENIANESVIRYLLDHKANVNAQDSFGSTPLHYAAMRGNTAAVRQLLGQHDINREAKDRAKMTALHIAASHGSINVCKQLLRAGCDVRNGQMTALHFAAMEGHLDIVELLITHAEQMLCLSNEAKIITDRDTAMHLAVENGHYKIVKYLIEKGANVNFVKENMITPLHLACRYGQLDIVKVLVKYKADIESKNLLLASPLHTAAMFNRVSVVEFLLQKGAEIDSFDKDKETPLLLAVRRGNLETVKFLLERNADVSITDTKDKTCLFVAAEENCIDVFKVLLDSPKASQLIEEFDKNDNTPLHIAAKKGHVEIVEMLVKADALIHAKNDSNLTPLHLAAQNGRSKIVEIFLSQESLNVVNDEDDSSNTPLHLAALEGHVKVVEILLNSGAAVDARNAMLWSPLDCAASRGWTKCAECLLDADSLIEPTDRSKTTPLHYASRAGHVEMIKLLISRKADISRKDHLGHNCLDWAIDNKQRESAIAILESDRWEVAMRSCTIEGGRIETPMRKMIKKLPEVAELVFNKCITNNGLPKEHVDYQVKCNYEYLEDSFSEWGPSREYVGAPKTPVIEGIPESSVINTSSMAKEQSLLSKITNVSEFSYFKKSEFKIDHPLKHMMQNEQTKLLSHQLVTNLLRYKWRTFGRFVYYTHLLIYLFYLVFVTGFGLTVVADDYEYNCTTRFDNVTKKMAKVCECVLNPNSTYYQSPSEATRYVFEQNGRPIILLVAISLFCIEVGKLLTSLSNYLNVHCYLKLASYSCSVLYVLSSYDFPDGSAMEVMEDLKCLYPHKSNGAITIWMAWINLVLFIRVFPKLGIYVMMMSEIMQTFFQCFTVVILFVVGFGLGFHMLLHNQKPISYITPQRAIMKAFMGMLAEFEFDQIFNEDFRPVPVAWALFVIYIIINCIILMNMLVGLAVDDIKGVQEQALLKKIGMQVDHTLEVEKTLPMSLQRKFMKLEETIYVNQIKGLNLWSFWKIRENKGQIVIMNHLESLVKQQYDLAEHLRLLKNKVTEMEASNNRKEAFIETLLKSKGISLEELG